MITGTLLLLFFEIHMFLHKNHYILFNTSLFFFFFEEEDV
jgi:hypothetical protein